MNAKLPMRFTAVEEAQPATKWLRHYHAALPTYRRWFDSEGELKRPALQTCEQALQSYMPELWPMWQTLVALCGADDQAARLLSFYQPAAFVSGCSQAVWSRTCPTLVRNYEHWPDHCEARIMKTRWHDTTVIASTDCLWGVLDGMNEHGLCVSQAFGGRGDSGEGFAVALVLRYVLEFCRTADEAVQVLCRVPSHMAYNVTVLDAWGQVRTVELTPFGNPKVTHCPAAVNHQGEFDLSNYAMLSQSHERLQFLLNKLVDPLCNVASFVNAFEYQPLFSSSHGHGFGTLYTAVYNPQLRAAEYRWRGGARMYQSFACFEEQELWTDLA